VVPIIAWSSNNAPISVSGQDGSTVLNVLIQSGRKNVLLKTPNGDPLADCRATPTKEFTIHNRDGEYFGTLSPGDDRSHFKMQLRHGPTLHMRGSFKDFEMSVTDSNGCVFARAEKCVPSFDQGKKESYFGTILGSGTDVGLLVSGILCTLILATAEA